MFDTFNLSLINETSIDVYILPALERDKDSGFDPASIALTWQVVSIKETKMRVQVNFTDPIAISPLSTFDEIIFNITDASLLFSPALQKNLHADFWVLTSKVRKQML